MAGLRLAAGFFVFAVFSRAFADGETLRLIFAGDLMGHITQINAAQREAGGKGYDYNPVYQHLKPYFSGADLSVINLEHTLGGEPYTGYPEFSSPDESMFAIKDAGFDLIATANNHSLDRSKKGLERTVAVLDSMGLKHFGIYRDAAERESRYPLIVEKNGIKMAFLNYTYGTNSLVEKAPNIVNRIDTAQIAADIAKAKRSSPDAIIAFMHWGAEYENVENKEQRGQAAFLARNGVNLIIGGHPHVVQPFGKVAAPAGADSVPVIYSLGNFVSNQRRRYTDGGVIFDVSLRKSGGKIKVVDYGYMPFWVYRFIKDGGNAYRLLPECGKDEPPCNEYNMSAEDRGAMELFFSDTKKTLSNLPLKKGF
jgi:poly-gamma-glutamate synthesis protein (capsule biosynthesis protein)